MKPHLDVILSVDWEGTSLDQENLQGIREFKASHGVPFVHYLSPAYATDPAGMDGSIDKALKLCISEEDEVGLHLHVPQHFVAAAGVPLRAKPTFSALGDQHSGPMFGQEVMLHAYSASELKDLVVTAFNIFKSWGLPQAQSFRAGGWMMCEEHLRALADLNFLIDSSAVPSCVLAESCWKSDSLHRYVDLLWPEISVVSGPYKFDWSEVFLEIPNNLGAIDYWTMEQQERYCQTSCNQAMIDGQHTIVVTAHQESFAKYRPKLESFVNQLYRLNELSINFTTNQPVLDRYSTLASEVEVSHWGRPTPLEQLLGHS